MPRIYGEKIMLREFKKEDLEHIRKWVNNAEITDNLSDMFLYPHTMNSTESFLDSILNDKLNNEKIFAIADKITEEYIGQISLFNIDWKNRIAQIAIVIGNVENQDKGIGYGAMKLIQSFAFNMMNLNKLELTVHEFNFKAHKLYMKCGFVEEGRLRQKTFTKGKYFDLIYMGILKSEYDAIISNYYVECSK